MATPVVDVYVKLPTGKTISHDFLPSENVEAICKYVAKEEGVDETRVRFKYQGKMLERSKTIGYLGIQPETILKCEVILHQYLQSQLH